MEAIAEIHGLRRLAQLAIVGWSVLSFFLWSWGFHQYEQEALRLAGTQAKAHMDRELVLRLWIAEHGGIYVRQGENTPSNPFLANIPERDVVTPGGQRLTLVNASYLSRLIKRQEEAVDYGMRKKISSPQPINPDNRPEDWEAPAYAAFVAGANTHSTSITYREREFYVLSHALRTEAACLKCHHDHQVGDLLGALTVMIDLAPYREAEQAQVRRKLLIHLLTWLTGLAGILLALRALMAQVRCGQQAFHKLNERHALFQTLAECSLDWVFWQNPDGSFRYVSPACLNVCGYSPEDLYRDPLLFLNMVHEDDRETFRIKLAEAIDQPMSQEFRIRHRDGSVRFLVQTCRPIHDAQGVFLGLRGANRDITEKREQEQILINQSRHAAMGEMIGNIAHQWRQPITALGLMLQNLAYDFKDGLLTEERLNETIARAQHQIDQMSSTINDFRNYFRPESTPSRFAIAYPIEEAIKIVRDSFQAHGIELEWTPGPPLEVFGYPNELIQVLLNLLTNSRDAIRERQGISGRVSIEVSGTPDQVVIDVRDNGGGIAPEALPRIFDPYFTTKAEGTGIGLYMSAMLIEHMRGSLIANNVAEGAEFRIRLPLAREQEGQ